MSKLLFAFTLIFLLIPSASAQGVVTADDVDGVASRMFCPICENEPLDQCYNATCIQWKNEIGNLLAEGYSNDEVIALFVDRYGDQVVGVPQSPLARILSYSAPIITTILAIILGFMTFRRWQQHQALDEPENISDTSPSADSYRSQIERDLM